MKSPMLSEGLDRPEKILEEISRLTQADRKDDAELLAERARTAYPENPHIALAHARCAQHRGDLAAAIMRCSEINQRFPNFSQGYEFGANVSILRGDLNAADCLALKAMEVHPNGAGGYFVYARCAMARRDPLEGLRRWRQASEKFPENVDAQWNRAQAALIMGDLAEAESSAEAAIRIAPSHLHAMRVWAEIAVYKRDWVEALSRWTRALEKHPDSLYLKDGIGQTRIAMEFDLLENSTVVPDVAVPDSQQEDIALVSLFSEFESLGSNCEFGLVQRYVGLEPLGLLRWANITPERLAKLFESNFEGVGIPENTSLEITPTGEYSLRDKRYFGMHTFLKVGQIPEEKLFRQMTRRLSFLKDKMIEDLQLAEKIFVYKFHQRNLTDYEIRRIFDAMRRFGPCRLLCVHHPWGNKQNHTLEDWGDGLFVGFMSELTSDPHDYSRHFDAWVGLCQGTRRLACMQSISSIEPQEPS